LISPLAADDEGALLNVNADSVAAALAAALQAEKLLLVVDVPGVLSAPPDPASLVSYTDLEGLQELRSRGALDGGMAPKSAAIEAALRGGVGRAHLVPWRVPDSLLLEVFTNEGCGTLVVPSLGQLSAAEQVEAEEGR
jgi:acetylglutamate kinase